MNRRKGYSNFICKVEGKEPVKKRKTPLGYYSPLPRDTWDGFPHLINTVLEFGKISFNALNDAFLWGSHPNSEDFNNLSCSSLPIDDTNETIPAPTWLTQMCQSWKEQLIANGEW